jgi:hypothetical protein
MILRRRQVRQLPKEALGRGSAQSQWQGELGVNPARWKFVKAAVLHARHKEYQSAPSNESYR